MAKIYTIDFLKTLRESPLVSRPPGLTPIEEWMGLALDSARNNTKPKSNRARQNNPDILIDSLTYRSVLDKHLPQSNTNFEETNAGPSKTPSNSSNSIRNTNKKMRVGENDRGRENRINTLRNRRTESDQENEGWSTVQPRKSFGGEEGEKFTSRPGGNRNKNDKVPKDREECDGKDRSWGSSIFPREKEVESDQFRDRTYRNCGLGRGRNESSWLKDRENHELSLSPRDHHSNSENHVDRSRLWRSREKDDKSDFRSEKLTDKIKERRDQRDRRWDRGRDHRHENNPEWMDDPGEDKHQAHTVADFEKWKEQMQGKDRVIKNQLADKNIEPDISLSNSEKPTVDTPLDIDPGPDKFLGPIDSNEETTAEIMGESMNERVVKSKTYGKASRFTSFFTSQDEFQRITSESLSTIQHSPNMKNSLKSNNQSEAEKEAFQQLLQKLQRQTFQASNSISPANISSQPKHTVPEKSSNSITLSQDNYQNYTNELQDEVVSSTRLSQKSIQELFLQQQIGGNQNTIRPDQVLQNLVSQRQNALDQNPSRVDQQPSRNTNTEFLMGLIQSSKSLPDSKRSESIHVGNPPESDSRQILNHNTLDLEQDIQREALVMPELSIHERLSRPQLPPGFYEDSSFRRVLAPIHDQQSGNSQPAQIIQRPPPPGLDMGWERQVQITPPQHRHIQNIVPPPGLSNNINRVIPIPQQAFPPGFSVGSFPPPDVMSVSPRNIQMQPPPGFFNGPPHGFIPPAMGGFQGPESMAFGTAPFDGRGPPAQGTFRR